MMNIADVSFWEKAWKEAKQASFLMNTQAATPERWAAFYNQVSGIYQRMWDSRRFGNQAANLLLSEGLIKPGDSVLDAGCGPGTLTIPLAEKGMQVTGLDYSQGMIQALQENAKQMNLKHIRTVCESFGEYRPDTLYHLVTAAFFPPSLEPEGILRLESWSEQWCAVMIGAGDKERMLHHSLWRAVMNTAPQSGRWISVCIIGYLTAGGRMPCIKYISQKYRVCQPFEEILKFYKAYFAMFGHGGKETEKVICDILKPLGRDEAVEFEEEMNIGLIWWRSRR